MKNVMILIFANVTHVFQVNIIPIMNKGIATANAMKGMGIYFLLLNRNVNTAIPIIA